MNRATGVLMLVALPACATSAADSKALHTGQGAQERHTELPVGLTGSAAPVVIAPEVLHGFTFLYQYVNETEFVLCLEGRQKKDRVYVTGFRLAVITRTTIGSASYEPCTTPNYVGTAHNHPVGPPGSLCLQSEADRVSFHNDAHAVVDIVLCGNTRYLWVLKDGRSDVTQHHQLVARRTP